MLLVDFRAGIHCSASLFLAFVLSVFLSPLCYALLPERLAPPLQDIVAKFPAKPAAETELLQKRVAIVVDDNGLSDSKVYVAIRIQDDEAVKDYSQIHVPYDSYFSELALEFANVLEPSGNIKALQQDAVQVQTPQQTNFYQDRKELTFSLPALKKGSVIEFQYRIKDTQPLIPDQWYSRFYFYWWEMKANSEFRIDAIRQATLDVEYPKHFELLIEKPAIVKDSKLTSTDSNKRYHIELNNLPKLKPEAAVAPDFVSQHRVELSTLKHWHQISDWVYSLVEPQIQLNKQLKSIAANLAAKNDSRDQKIRAVYQYMQENIRYVFAHVGRGGYQPHSAIDVFTNAYGDCKDQTVLTIALLRELGIEAHAALVSTASNSFLSPRLPFNGFDHMITFIPASHGEPPLWIDTSGTKSLYPGFHTSLEGQPALVVTGEPSATLTMIDKRNVSDHSATLALKMKPTEAGDLRVDFEIKVSGTYEDHYRSWWAYVPERHKALRNMVATIYPNARIENVKVINADNLWLPISIVGQLWLADAWNKEADTLTAAVGLNQLLRMFESIGRYDHPENRVNDFYVSTGYRLKLIADIEAPGDNYEAITGLAGPTKKTDYFSLLQNAEPTDNGYHVEIEFELPQQTISQSQYHYFYNDFMGLENLNPWVINFRQKESSDNLAMEQGDLLSAESRLLSVQRFIDNGKFQEALQAAEELIKAYPQNGEGYYLLGLAQGYQGFFEQSNLSFEKAVELGYEL